MPISVRSRTALAFAHDVVAASVAWCAAFWLRFNLEVPDPYFSVMLMSLAWVVPLQAAVFWLFGLYRGIWRYASVADVQRIVFAVLVAAMAVGFAVTGGILLAVLFLLTGKKKQQPIYIMQGKS